MADFNMSDPPLDVTNPKGNASSDYPRHVHKYAKPPTQAEITAGQSYTSGEFLIVHDDKEKAAALKDGWSETPVLVDPDAPKADDTKKPAKGK